MSGLISGLAFGLWIGFGGPKPPTPRLPLSIEGCSFDGFNVTQLPVTSMVPKAFDAVRTDNYFPLYRISYMWYAPLGFLVTILVAQLVSRAFNRRSASRGMPTHKIDENLLSPVFPKCMRSAHHLQEPVLLVFTFFDSFIHIFLIFLLNCS